MVDVPEEICDLNPQKTCHFATKLVPSLKPEHKCTLIPNEVCQLKFNPRIEKKPLKSEWCLDESPIQPDETYDESSAVAPPVEYSAQSSRISRVFIRHPWNPNGSEFYFKERYLIVLIYFAVGEQIYQK